MGNCPFQVPVNRWGKDLENRLVRGIYNIYLTDPMCRLISDNLWPDHRMVNMSDMVNMNRWGKDLENKLALTCTDHLSSIHFRFYMILDDIDRLDILRKALPDKFGRREKVLMAATPNKRFLLY